MLAWRSAGRTRKNKISSHFLINPPGLIVFYTASSLILKVVDNLLFVKLPLMAMG